MQNSLNKLRRSSESFFEADAVSFINFFPTYTKTLKFFPVIHINSNSLMNELVVLVCSTYKNFVIQLSRRTFWFDYRLD